MRTWGPAAGATQPLMQQLFPFFFSWFFFFVFLVESHESICSVQQLDMTKSIVVRCFSGVHIIVAHVSLGRPPGLLGGHHLEFEVTMATAGSGNNFWTAELYVFISEPETSRLEPQMWTYMEVEIGFGRNFGETCDVWICLKGHASWNTPAGTRLW